MRQLSKKFLPLIPVISLLYMRYYETTLGLRMSDTWQSRTYDLLYSHLFIPVFYIVTTYLIVDIIYEYFKLNCSAKTHCIIKYFLLIVALGYCCYLVVLFKSVVRTPLIPFISPRIILYFLLGLLFTFFINKKA